MGKHKSERFFNLAHGTEILHQSNWAFLAEVVVLTPSMMGQVAQGYSSDKSINMSSQYLVSKLSGERTNAMDLLVFL